MLMSKWYLFLKKKKDEVWRLKELKNEDWEWKEVEKIFWKTMDVEVKELYRIENNWLWNHI